MTLVILFLRDNHNKEGRRPQRIVVEEGSNGGGGKTEGGVEKRGGQSDGWSARRLAASVA